jgi:hypothetical protein
MFFASANRSRLQVRVGHRKGTLPVCYFENSDMIARRSSRSMRSSERSSVARAAETRPAMLSSVPNFVHSDSIVMRQRSVILPQADVPKSH